MIEDQDPAEVVARLAKTKVAESNARVAEDQRRGRSHVGWYTRPRARPKDGKEELSRERFFARLSAFELACPRCGWLWSARRGKGKAWNARTHVWTCRRCALRLQLGLVAYVAPVDPARTYAPEDTVPTLAEARALAAAGAPCPDADDPAGPGLEPPSPLAARARALAAETGESFELVFERLEKAARGLAWKAWGATLRAELKRERLPKNSRINKLHDNEPK